MAMHDIQWLCRNETGLLLNIYGPDEVTKTKHICPEIDVHKLIFHTEIFIYEVSTLKLKMQVFMHIFIKFSV
jgi:hypothetical protein